MHAPSLPPLPARWTALALGVAARDRLGVEWRATGLHRWLRRWPRPDGLGATPRDNRPADPAAGRRILAGVFELAGERLDCGVRGDPFDRPGPGRRFARSLHRFDWMADLLAAGPDGAAEGLRLTLAWRRGFSRWNAFAWSPGVLERRVFNLACAANPICARASDAEKAIIAGELAWQARLLLSEGGGPLRAAERAAVAAVAGAALLGRAAKALRGKALTRLDRALPITVPREGGHASRSPQAALELLFDLQTLEDALTQHGQASSGEMLRAMDRLAAAVRMFTGADGRLAAFHGGEPVAAPYVAAARAQDELEERAMPSAAGGCQRLESRAIQVIADAAPAAAGPWSAGACGQPLAIDVCAGGARLIVGSGWSAESGAPLPLRLVDAASTASIGDLPCGEPLRGYPAQVLGPRLVRGAAEITVTRQDTPAASLLELAHDGWVERFGLTHRRTLYVEGGELRGEDSFVPAGGPAKDGRRFTPFMVRFQLHPQVSALVARDRKSVLLKTEGATEGWWLRNDALEVSLEPSLYVEGGRGRRSQQVVLRGQARMDTGARVRWKLSSAAPIPQPLSTPGPSRVDDPAPGA